MDKNVNSFTLNEERIMNIKWLNVISLLLFLAAIMYKLIDHQAFNMAGVLVATVFICMNLVALMRKNPT